MRYISAFVVIFFSIIFFLSPKNSDRRTILNVSYDPTRELFDEYNKEFIKFWHKSTGEEIEILSSNSGSGKQARAIIDGLKGDIATLAVSYDIDAIAKRGLIEKDWKKKFPNNSCPYNSIIVFLVRKGNPKNIQGWEDLTKNNVEVITPNPKTSGGARWNYLAAYAYAMKRWNDEDKAHTYLEKLFLSSPVLDATSRAATTTFIKRKMGDVLITWENEAHLAIEKLGKDKFEIITPKISVLTEPSVAVVDSVVIKKNTKNIANLYISFLYSDKASKIIAKHYYRPANKKTLQKYRNVFPEIELKTIADFGGWEMFHMKHFSEDGVFDRFYN
jgi:sulfate transport system substrate-binding protein